MTSVWKSSIFSQWERKEVYSKRKYHVNAAGGLDWVGRITVSAVTPALASLSFSAVVQISQRKMIFKAL